MLNKSCRGETFHRKAKSIVDQSGQLKGKIMRKLASLETINVNGAFIVGPSPLLPIFIKWFSDYIMPEPVGPSFNNKAVQ